MEGRGGLYTGWNQEVQRGMECPPQPSWCPGPRQRLAGLAPQRAHPRHEPGGQQRFRHPASQGHAHIPRARSLSGCGRLGYLVGALGTTALRRVQQDDQPTCPPQTGVLAQALPVGPAKNEKARTGRAPN
ncbi:hypothetical protein B484DRAFT_442346 [Ochromonadaceae sp. CCMP2298]|nr:hypothetical protein B484DRAFT_442346 [Ochromonadaceae sp. CCMP2298]